MSGRLLRVVRVEVAVDHVKVLVRNDATERGRLDEVELSPFAARDLAVRLLELARLVEEPVTIATWRGESHPYRSSVTPGRCRICGDTEDAIAFGPPRAGRTELAWALHAPF